MIPVSDRFLAAIRESHTVSFVAHVFKPSAPTVPVQVPVVGGQVTVDRDARVRRQGTLEVAFALEDAATREAIRELPFGGYATVERGPLYADGTSERVQLGRFRVESIVWSELQGSATLTLQDGFAQVQDEPFVTPYAPDGLHPSDAAVQAVQQVFGTAIQYHVETDPASEPVLSGTVYDEDRAAAVGDLASSVAAVAFFDHQGDFVIRPRDQNPPIAWTVDAGDRGSMVAAQETLDRSSVRNGVSVRGQVSPDLPPLYALATFDDPASPLRWGGPFGRVALIASSTAVASQAAADATAASLLNLRLGLSRTCVLEALPNPALEPDDRIVIVFPDGRQETHTVNRVEIGLAADGALAITTTSQLPTPALEPSRFRIYRGDQVWRALADATRVPA